MIDTKIAVREVIIFLGIFGILVLAFALLAFLGQQLLVAEHSENQWMVSTFALLFVAFLVRPVEKLLQKTIGRYLFKKRYEYQKALQDAAVGMATIRDSRKLLNLIVHIISIKIRLENVSILIYDDARKLYMLKASRGKNKPTNLEQGVSGDEPFVEWLKEKRQPLALESLNRWIKDERRRKSAKSILTSDLVKIKDGLRKLNASLCVPSFYRNELLGIVALGDKESKDQFTQDDISLFGALADEAAIAIRNSQLYTEIDKRAKEMERLYEREHSLFMNAAAVFAAAIDARDPYTHGHSERVTNYSMAILDYLEYAHDIVKNPVFRQRLQIAAILHDIGKIGVSDDILHKPAALTPEERVEIEKHPTIGADIVSRVKGLGDIVGGIKHHHERYDGKGYPDGLKSDNIPFVARIIAVADTYDAMTSDRPYRKGLGDDVAREEIMKNQTTQFDPYMAAAFLKAFEDGRIVRGRSNL
ncbi:MAG: HD domain-containing phosphohydrolase [Candidatus Omnitrophota bacterium]